MPAAAQIRAEIEAALARRIPSALTPSPRIIRPTVATGISALDELLDGGLSVGAITEIVGPECSGRTSLALAFLAQITHQGKVTAWIDVSDALHPESAAAAGVDLDRLLWVRCGGQAAPCACQPENSFEAVDPPQSTRVNFGGNSPHPRSESNGIPDAISDLLGVKAKYKRDRIIGTPGAPNRALSSPQSSREEQVSSDRLPARRGDSLLEQRAAYEPRCAEPQRKPRPRPASYEQAQIAGSRRDNKNSSTDKPWLRLDQAIRVTDLLLQAGGFSAIVLDMGSITPEHVSRIPLATWFRYRAAAEQSRTSLILLSQNACAKSSAEVVLRLDIADPQSAGSTVFSGLINHAELVRRRYEQESMNIVPMRKLPQRVSRADWRSSTTWAMPRQADSR